MRLLPVGLCVWLLACGGAPVVLAEPHPELEGRVSQTVQGNWDPEAHALFEADLLRRTKDRNPGVQVGAWRDLGDARVAVAEMLWSLDEPPADTDFRKSQRSDFEPRAWTWRHRAMDAWRAGEDHAEMAGLTQAVEALRARVATQEKAEAARRARLETEFADERAMLDDIERWLGSCEIEGGVDGGPESIGRWLARLRRTVENGSYDPTLDADVLEVTHTSMAARCE